MQTSAAGRAAIAQREGNKLKAYTDSVGVLTIGVGHTTAAGPPIVTKGLTITAAQSDQILSRDLATFETAVNKAVKVPLSQGQFDALVSLAFNIGAGAFAKSTLVKRLNAGNVAGAAEAFMMWNKPPEIIGRRKTEQKQFVAGSKPSKAAPAPAATKQPATPQPSIPAASSPIPVPEPATPPPAPDLIPVVPDPPTKETVQTVQKRLADLGYNPGGADGLMGPLTRGAVLSFKNDNGLTPNDVIDEAFLTVLATASPRKMQPARANATVSDVAAKIPEAKVHWWTRLSAGLLGGSVGSVGLLDQITPAVGYLTPVKDFLGDVPAAVWIGGIVLVCGILYVSAQYGAKKATEAFQAGDRR